MAGLTQAVLAERLGVTRSTVSNAETGKGRVGRRYLDSVLSVCGITQSTDGHGERVDVGANTGDEDLPLDWVRRPQYCVGLDPETAEPVRRGSPRDLELRETYPRWALWANVEVYG